MGNKRFYVVMMLFITAVLGYLTYRIMSPFLPAIAWAIVFAIVFYPFFAYIRRYVKVKAAASLVTVVLLLIVIIAPIAYLSLLLLDELKGFADQMNAGSLDTVKIWVERLQATAFYETLSRYIGSDALPTEAVISDNIKKLGGIVIANLSSGLTNILAVTVHFIFMIFTIFFIFKDGPDFLIRIKDVLPFSNSQKEMLATQVKDLVVSTVYGGVSVALIQGLLGGSAFFFVGIQSPVLWGVLMSVMSFVPLLGTFSIWGPASVYLIFDGQYVSGIGLFLFGVLVISMVDNILKPMIIGSRTRLPTVLIFFSVLGGINLFGMIGLIMGPLIMALFISVFEIFSKMDNALSEGR
ncbi:MAG: AI-2E family transporter [Nitrospirae bacterium]|nr:AI-2E family transporter [Nitrospirota bacterium]